MIYGRRWNFTLHRPIDPLDPVSAAGRDAYAAANISDISDIPDFVVEVAWPADHVGVWFLDDDGRRTLRYSFRRHGDRLFLHAITQWDYPDGSGRKLSRATRIDSFEFAPDGTGTRIIKDSRSEVSSARHGIDVSSHWEPVPSFGHWESLTRWDRTQ